MFNKFKDYELYKYLGCHKENNKWTFRVYAPHAQKVYITGTFNPYAEDTYKMTKRKNGVFEISLTNVKEYDHYRYIVIGVDGILRRKIDPFAFYSSNKPSEYSIVYNYKKIKARKIRRTLSDKKPLNIYEVSLAGFKRHLDTNRYYNYIELKEIYDHAAGFNYNAVELMPITEYPSDKSWGYQPSGLFSPTSRYGEPTELVEMLNYGKERGMLTILDVVLGHFCVDIFSLEKFDGTDLFESYFNVQWGVHNYDFESEFVRSFLKSSVFYFLEVLGFDGVRIDAVSNFINYDGDSSNHLNEAAIGFLTSLNNDIHKYFKNKKIVIAEDSSIFPGITHSNGLDFDYKWNLGYMHDTLDYFETDPIYRSKVFDKLTFSFHYKDNERYMLCYSHDEVVHLKKSMFSKMPGSYEVQYEHLKTLLSHMIMHPGKKILFMGSEFGVEKEFDEAGELDWSVLENEKNKQLAKFVCDVNRIYLDNESLWKWDYLPKGFSKLYEHADDGILCYGRHSLKQTTCIILNTSGNYYEDYFFEFKKFKSAEVLLNSADPLYGGRHIIEKDYTLENGGVFFKIAPNSAIIMKLSKS